MSKIRKGVILAAGLGTRFLPVTKVLPKEMLPVLDKPVLQYTVEELVGSGMEEVVIIINKEKRQERKKETKKEQNSLNLYL